MFRRKKVILFVALPEEFSKDLVPKGVDIYYTGCGKVNAAIVASQTLYKFRNQKNILVLNYGSAGSAIHQIGKLVRATKFRQGDIDASLLGFARGITLYDEKFFNFNTTEINFGEGETCYSVDNLTPENNFSIEDMEAYSIAKVCKMYNLSFVSYKFITNNFNDSAKQDWQKNISQGIDMFKRELLTILG